MVGGYQVSADQFRKTVSRSFSHPARVHKNQGGPGAVNQFCQPLVHLVPDLVRGNARQPRRHDFNPQIHVPPVADIHNLRLPTVSAQERSHVLDGLLSGGEADSLHRFSGELRQSFQAEAQVGTSLVTRQRMDLVDDHRSNPFQQFGTALTCQENEEGLRSGNQDVGRTVQRAPSLRGRSVACSNQRPDFREVESRLGGSLPDLLQGCEEIVPDVVRQGFQGRDVQHFRGVFEALL